MLKGVYMYYLGYNDDIWPKQCITSFGPLVSDEGNQQKKGPKDIDMSTSLEPLVSFFFSFPYILHVLMTIFS